MNKKAFTSAVAQQAKVSIAMAEAVMDATVQVAAKELAEQGTVRVPGIASIVAKDYAARPGRNPKTGEAKEVPAATRLRLKPGLELSKQFTASKAA